MSTTPPMIADDGCPLMTRPQCEKLINDVADIRRAIIGNEDFKEVGLVDRVTALEAYRSVDQLRWAKIGGIILAGSTVISFVVPLVVKHFTEK